MTDAAKVVANAARGSLAAFTERLVNIPLAAPPTLSTLAQSAEEIGATDPSLRLTL
jgi:hypothetical protein